MFKLSSVAVLVRFRSAPDPAPGVSREPRTFTIIWSLRKVKFLRFLQNCTTATDIIDGADATVNDCYMVYEKTTCMFWRKI